MLRSLHMKEPFNAWSHFVPFLAAIGGLIFVIYRSVGDTAKLITLTLYCSSIILVFGASTLYHWLRVSPRAERLLRKIDHMAIYVLIAGTYTPILFYGLRGPWRGVMLSAVWVLAIGGIILKAAWANLPRTLSTALYIGLGWLAVIPFSQLVSALPRPVSVLILLGGLSYTCGAVIYARKRLSLLPKTIGFHEVFHVCIALGGLLHFIAIIWFVLPL